MSITGERRLIWRSTSEWTTSPDLTTEQHALKHASAYLREVPQHPVRVSLLSVFATEDGALREDAIQSTLFTHANQVRRRLETVIVEDASRESRHQEEGCRFCRVAASGEARLFGTVAAFFDGYPVTPGHTLIVPVAHRGDYFGLTQEEIHDTDIALRTLRDEFAAAGVTAFNIGWNVGEVSGQTIPHAHCHLIPRRPGDMEDPTGGVRGVIPEKQKYVRRGEF